MGKFGKKNHISLDPANCSIIFLGQPKIGKTTLMKEFAEKTVGEDGYLFLEMYREQGADLIEGINYENVETWAKFEEVVSDIEVNKDTDYPELKMVMIDTWDNAILLAEQEALRLWNRDPDHKRTDNISAAYGGFQRGQDKAGELLDEMKSRLEAVGIKVDIIMHVKNKEITDPVMGDTYQQITSDVSQKYFNRIKRNMDVTAVGYIDREIIKEKTGKKTIKGEDIEKNIISSETRKIKFRDNGYAIDAGGRLKYIVDDIDFTSEAFYKAIKDALKAEAENKGVDLKERAKEDKAKAKKEEAEAAEVIKENKRKSKIDKDHNEELVADIKTIFSHADGVIKDKCRDIVKNAKIKNFDELLEMETDKLEALANEFRNVLNEYSKDDDEASED